MLPRHARGVRRVRNQPNGSLSGIARVKAVGVYKGPPASIDVTKVRRLKAKGMGASEIAKALKIGRASVYRVLGERAWRARVAGGRCHPGPNQVAGAALMNPLIFR
jgi:Helix-turn-helix domain of resolvase